MMRLIQVLLLVSMFVWISICSADDFFGISDSDYKLLMQNNTVETQIKILSKYDNDLSQTRLAEAYRDDYRYNANKESLAKSVVLFDKLEKSGYKLAMIRRRYLDALDAVDSGDYQKAYKYRKELLSVSGKSADVSNFVRVVTDILSKTALNIKLPKDTMSVLLASIKEIKPNLSKLSEYHESICSTLIRANDIKAAKKWNTDIGEIYKAEGVELPIMYHYYTAYFSELSGNKRQFANSVSYIKKNGKHNSMKQFAVMAGGSGGFDVEVFGVVYKNATRDLVRKKAKESGAIATREEDDYWYDVYDASHLITGAKKLYLGYLTSGELADVIYVFDNNFNAYKVVNMLKTKYPFDNDVYSDIGIDGYPHLWFTYYPYLWDMSESYTWTVQRNINSKETTLTIVNKDMKEKLENAIKKSREAQAKNNSSF